MPIKFKEIEYEVKEYAREALKALDPRAYTKYGELRKDSRGLLMCRGRMVGMHALFVPTLLAEKTVRRVHHLTLHGGVALTITKIRLGTNISEE